MAYQLHINNHEYEVDVDAGTPLLWVLRDTLGLTGTKFGCGEGVCGACTVHVSGRADRSCLLPVESLAGREITTIEHIGSQPYHPVVLAWIEEQTPQCGFCQCGQIMSAAALLEVTPSPTYADIDHAMTSLCRCGTYPYIRKSVHRAAAIKLAQAPTQGTKP